MTLTEVIRATAARTAAVTVTVNKAQSWVSIGADVFMQGDEADAFLDEAERIWNEAGDVGIDEVYACLAEPYLA